MPDFNEHLNEKPMETIYDWLLHHVSNEANYYTILNCQRSKTPHNADFIRIMGRLHDFTVLNLLVFSGSINELPSIKPEAQLADDHAQHLIFSDSQQVIDYLATGKADEDSLTSADAIQIWVMKPVGEAGEITFPFEQGS